MSGSLLSSTSKFFGPDETLDIPSIVVQVTTGVGCYIIWAGTTNYTPAGGTEADERVVEGIMQQGKLGSDWACSMASPKMTMPISGTTLLRTSKDAVALPLSQRLAQRFKKQIFASIDLNPGHITGGKGPTIALAVEKAIMKVLISLEKNL